LYFLIQWSEDRSGRLEQYISNSEWSNS
jgi:hypothetical protein